jgi:hypothetical protein
MDQKVVGFNWELDIRRAVAEDGVIAVCPVLVQIIG